MGLLNYCLLNKQSVVEKVCFTVLLQSNPICTVKVKSGNRAHLLYLLNLRGLLY